MNVFGLNATSAPTTDLLLLDILVLNLHSGATSHARSCREAGRLACRLTTRIALCQRSPSRTFPRTPRLPTRCHRFSVAAASRHQIASALAAAYASPADVDLIVGLMAEGVHARCTFD